MKEITIYSSALTNAHLTKLSDEEKSFLFLITHLANEISMLLKACLYTSTAVVNESNANNVARNATISQFYFFTRMLAGKLYEGWILIKKRYNGKRLQIKYKNNTHINNVLCSIQDYFSYDDNLVKYIRHNHAFHGYDEKNNLLNLLKNTSADRNYIFYDSENLAGRYYHASEALIIDSIENWYTTKNGETEDIQKLILRELLDVARMFNDLSSIFLDACLMDIMEGNEEGLRKISEELRIEVMNKEDIMMPFFSENRA